MHSNPKEQGVRMCIAIDEAQFLTGSSDASGAVIRSLIEEGRKYGMSIVIVTHAASMLSRQIVANASAFVAFYAREPSEAGYVAKLIAGNDAQRTYEVMAKLRTLKQHEAIMVSCNARDPLLVMTPRMKELGKRLKADERTGTRSCTDDAALLSRTKMPVPYDTLAKEYGIEAVDGQVARGALEKLELRWNGKDEAWIMLRNGAVSLEHRICVQKIHEALDKQGVSNYITGGKGPDIVAHCKAGRVAIEYETGRKPLRESAAMIKSRVDVYAAVVIFTNSKAYMFYKSYFENGSVKVFDIADAATASIAL